MNRFLYLNLNMSVHFIFVNHFYISLVSFILDGPNVLYKLFKRGKRWWGGETSLQALLSCGSVSRVIYLSCLVIVSKSLHWDLSICFSLVSRLISTMQRCGTVLHRIRGLHCNPVCFELLYEKLFQVQEKIISAWENFMLMWGMVSNKLV